MRIVASIEARMGSSRLPGKVLMDIHGKPALARLVDRLRQCRRIDDIVVATSTGKGDDLIQDWAQSYNVPVYRGSEDDVLQRVVDAHRYMGSDIVVEITGDCPLLDPETVDLAIETFLANDCDVAANVRIPSYPQGTDVQVFRTKDLEKVAATIDDLAVREHVSLYFYENPSLYRILHMLAPRSGQAPDLRLQLDYPEDIEFIRRVYEQLEPVHGPFFGTGAILDLVAQAPDLAAINAHCIEKTAR
ncbi:cytidylyltransferase domain-containing protein [Sphingopyxis sp. C-1]|uniref:cytidylyltransferase domain-containing protein n=1 Tax=Sphingopyxis sp. C-1 TaxID=262667 RepID=UPI0006C1C735|nr:glycosyltransferase family protein [Sphingopyxis sp. C-1]GAO78932.1 N-acetylneuraminate cytidylyltransferase [Sphingopyxis sp. C-1]